MGEETTQGIVKGDVLQRLAGISFIVAAIATIAGDSEVPKEYIEAIANAMGGRWETAQLLILVGLWALMVGMVGVYRSISTGGAAAWARLGFYGVIVGTTLGTLHHGIELGFPALVEEWEEATGSDKAMLLQIGTSIRQVDLGIIDVSAIVLSLALTFLGVGMVLSRVYPRWLG